MFSRSSSNRSEIFNGARCEAYSWSQSHEDLEIRVRVDPKRYDDVNVILSSKSICVELAHNFDTNNKDPAYLEPIETLVKGEFEHPIDKESAYWVVERDQQCIVIYIDKAEELWWKHLLLDEEVTEVGVKSYNVTIDSLNAGSRMAIDKLMVDQRNKLKSSFQTVDDDFSPA